MFLFFVLVFFAFAKAQSDSSVYKQQVSLQHDNDLFFGIDRYYTAGTFLGYSRLLENDLLFKHQKDGTLQLDLRLGQETYTPRELFESDFDLLERPYAGYLFVSGAVSKAQKNQIWQIQTEIGLAGPQSLAGEIQVAYHELINEFIPVWEGQIANSFHINFQGAYTVDFSLGGSYVFKNVSLTSKASLGTRLTFLEQEALVFLGKRAPIAHSSGFGRIGSIHEFFGYAGISYRYVVNNALIEGHPFGDDSPFTLDAIPSIFRARSGVVYKGSRNTYTLEYNFNTRETSREGHLNYVAIILRRSF